MEWLRRVVFLFWLCRRRDSFDRLFLHAIPETSHDALNDSRREWRMLFVGVRESRSQPIDLVVSHGGDVGL